MSVIAIIGILYCLVTGLFTFALCRAAARGDQMTEEAIENDRRNATVAVAAQ